MLRGTAGLLHFQLKEHGTSASATLLGSVNSSGEDSGIDIAAAAASAQSRSHALPFPGHSFACPLLCFALLGSSTKEPCKLLQAKTLMLGESEVVVKF